MAEPLTIAFLGGIPPLLGGGGLEIQMARQQAALEALGHVVVRAECAAPDVRPDLLHVFGSEPDAWHRLRHWRRNPCPLVLTPVLTVSPGAEERTLRLAARLPGPMTSAKMKKELLARADLVLPMTAYERSLAVDVLGADPARVEILPNGLEPVAPLGRDTLPAAVPAGPYGLLLGRIEPRKGQARVLAASDGAVPLVVAGGLEGDAEARAGWERLVARTGATWLGELHDRVLVATLEHHAAALVLLSETEVQSLAALESLAQGTPVIASDIPAHRELREAYPEHVLLARSATEVPPLLRRLADGPRSTPAPSVPTLAETTERLLAAYRRLL